MPLIAHAAILADVWRNGWLAVGATVLIVGFVPNWLLMVRRPEDIGLATDQSQVMGPPGQTETAGPVFTRDASLRPPNVSLSELLTPRPYHGQAGDSRNKPP